ncbi:MAG: hypothetical protein CVU77_02780 [Elusimicrobia bacterium HGW-Elusimicrobia-1]|jgi:hypothetical protein|nr:MAG: hypothetical protein CVU77_02780 [Elusimicrobia bacterium HGW-Elusimicrobia-1]
MAILEVLRSTNFGQRVAEEEVDSLAQYFVETDHWRRLFSDEVDVIYGPKGAGKSALYSLLVGRKTNLFDRRILITVAENPRGATAFRALEADPPASEREFIALWKLYMACLVSVTLDDYGFAGDQAKELREHLRANGLLATNNLQRILISAFGYVKRLLRPTAVESSHCLDTVSQTSTITTKIIFGEPSAEQSAKGMVSLDHLLTLGDKALADAGYKLWVLLDRLDVAFADSPDLEQNALRALFHVYLDLQVLRNLRIKIFLRTDIWRHITTTGFREASHITRHLTIEWNRASMLNLIIRRATQNTTILGHYRENKDDVLSSTSKQEEFFYRLFPLQVEAGSRKSNTLDWILGRTCDASKQTAPREVIHLLNALRDAQVRKMEIGESEPEEGHLFSRAIFKGALSEVSKTRLEQTLYAEYPAMRVYIEKLRNENTQYSVVSLARIWNASHDAAMEIARELCTIGFFEERYDKNGAIFWVPMLYRAALDLVQGASE